MTLQRQRPQVVDHIRHCVFAQPGDAPRVAELVVYWPWGDAADAYRLPCRAMTRTRTRPICKLCAPATPSALYAVTRIPLQHSAQGQGRHLGGGEGRLMGAACESVLAACSAVGGRGGGGGACHSGTSRWISALPSEPPVAAISAMVSSITSPMDCE
eukprot:CAMPEP_0115884184 /NCGR_PEP_ID=MMETSP0287-20121206/29979_1 /TAXON_ID=412157 /ORGANISM="Chrysochromulina rotalis, Strain UIO044" /LENGTH=156 /DNA_ID=CAMNT_0003340465 /DNA_START=64 /DNA_END=535 /DNA_ORIENTATION=-